MLLIAFSQYKNFVYKHLFLEVGQFSQHPQLCNQYHSGIRVEQMFQLQCSRWIRKDSSTLKKITDILHTYDFSLKEGMYSIF